MLDAGRTAFLPLRPVRWLASFVSGYDIEPVFAVDDAALAGTVAALEGENRVAPAEPTIEVGDAGLQVRAGVPGSGLDVDELRRELPDAAAATDGSETIVVDVDTGPVAPTFSDAQAQAVADEGNALSATPLTVTVGESTAAVSEPTLRSWMRAVPVEGTLSLTLDQATITDTLLTLFPDVGQEPADAGFDVVDGQPIVIPGQDGTVCCEADTVDRMLTALRDGTTQADVALVITPPEFTTDEANALGIIEEIGSPDEFGPTTRHPAGQARVQNIHRIADIIRGVVIEPGTTFSVNGFVGPRTRENGFVAAPVIYDGEFQTDVGGGVSQFATTMFNAALYAGLDFGEYQSHSIRIDRYPVGHEATISYPHPDLEIVNNTPYGVLIWPTYTASSITVHLYSTRYAETSLGSPSSRPQGNCTRITTSRTRTYPDGRVEEDSVFGVYRPGEGINC